MSQQNDSAGQRMLVQTSHYSLASLLTSVSGLVTFPLLTRVLSVADYGVMNLVAATLSISVALGKFGIQHSIIRYRSEIAAEKSKFTQFELYSTTLFGMLLTAVLAMTTVLVGLQVVPASWLPAERVHIVFEIAAFLIVIQVVESGLINFLRADQQTTTLLKYQVVKKYVTIGLILVGLLALRGGLIAFYVATLIAEAASVCCLAALLFRRPQHSFPALRDFSFPLYRQLIAFGLPMMIGYELSGIVLIVGDRYVIQGLIGEEPLGLYGAAYNLCQYAQSVTTVAVGQAVMPMYMRIWDKEGADRTAAFIGRALQNYLLLGIPLIAGMAIVGPELLPSLASEKYAGAATTLPWIMSGMVVDGANVMVGAGLFIHRKTKVIMAIVLVAATVNLLTNILLVPRFGILGSAVATLFSYAVSTTSMAIAGRQLLRAALPWATLLRAIAASGVMYFLVSRFHPGERLVTVGAQAVSGVIAYGAIMALIDSNARQLFRLGVQRVFPSLGRAQ